MKKLLCFLTAIALLLSLTACIGLPGNSGGDATEGTETQETTGPAADAAYPTGLYMMRWLGDENGDYVPEGNEFEDYDGTTTIVDRMYEDSVMVWCDIGEDGTATMSRPYGNDPVEMDFNTGEPGMLQYGSYLTPYYWNEETG